jgi:hypothetical protein
MNFLRNENVKKCLSLLKEFVDESSVEDSRKGVAMLALDQLKRITAGDGDPTPQCIGSPRADG